MPRKTYDELKNAAPSVQPFSLAEIREIALDAAGFEPEAVGAFVRKAVDKLIQKLEAKTTKHFAFEGIVQDEREMEDNAAQIKAASELIHIGADVTAMRRKSADEKPKGESVHAVNLVGWTINANVVPTEKLTDDATSI